ncbi:MAG TPA: S46 family peptidase [Bacteroidales bacterium]|nr:S46 family peptidase [Bacteroidales bacterium]
MKKVISFLIIIVLLPSLLHAKEGMWIPSLLNKFVEKDMRKMGMRLTAEEIYSINQASLKDAIIIFGGGCTGEVVSDQGLVLTNHHCGYGVIQSHSSVEHDYLTNGFWAMSKEEELPNPGLKATFLVRIEDVSEEVLAELNENMTEAERDAAVKEKSDELIEEAQKETHYKAVIKPFFYGNEYYMFVYEEYNDVRLVGAPPSNIGKFGGDTDNWMWPRHTGDFSVFRIYADKDNNPAEYSEDNVPYKPMKHLKISLKGYEKDDFTFVFGYPGSTEQYLPSYAIDNIVNEVNPIRIDMRTERLNIMDKYMQQDQKTRIQYAAKYAGTSNGWKKWQGENRGIKRMDAIGKKEHLEKHFMEWTSMNDQREKLYGGLVPAFEKIYTDLEPYSRARAFLLETLYGIEISRYARNFKKLVNLSNADEPDEEAIKKQIEKIRSAAKGHFKNYHAPIDKEITAKMLDMYFHRLERDLQPQIIQEIIEDYDADFTEYAEELFEDSFMSSEEEVNEFLDKYKTRKAKKIEKDPAYVLGEALYNHYFSNILPATSQWDNDLDSLQRIYIRGLKKYQKNRRFYPDANFTLRVTYGKIQGYEPRDAVEYEYFTTLEGVIAKEDPDIYDYVVEDKLKELYQEKDYGHYAGDDGKMHVCFIASNHTSGGNSGSPVLNADGHLIGLNFDRNWEGTMSDLMYDPDMCRNITLDVRYALFIIDKFAGAGHLVDEMTIIK